MKSDQSNRWTPYVSVTMTGINKTTKLTVAISPIHVAPREFKKTNSQIMPMANKAASSGWLNKGNCMKEQVLHGMATIDTYSI